KSSWLGELENVSLGHGVSLLRWRSGGFEHPHDTPPYPLMPSPTFAHSSETKPEERKSNAGRKPYDTILKFKIMVLQSLHNLSDERTEYLIRDRMSFMRFLDLELEDPVPDATTIWLFREALAQAGLIDKLFERFGQHLEAEGYIARGGQIIDATI